MKNNTVKIRVLVIGSLGMLGQELVDIFKKDRDYKVTGWDKREIDIANQKQVNQKIIKLNPDIIINSAAHNAVDKCEENKKEFELAKKINGLVPGYLAKIAKKIGAILVHYSSDYVFDGSPRFGRISNRVEAGNPDIPEPPGPPRLADTTRRREAGCAGSCGACRLHKNFSPKIGFTEVDKPRPISNYGKSKLLGEKEIRKVKGKNYIIRLSKLFGKPAKSEDAKRSFFDVMLEAGRKNKEVKIVDEEISCFTYAPDLAKKTKEIIESKKPFGIYHVTNSDSCTWYEAVVELYKQAKVKTKIISVGSDEFPRPAKRPYISTLINTKLNPLRSYKAALKDYLKNLKQI